MDAGSVIAVISANLVALAAIAAGLWQQRRGFAHERRLADRAGVRDLLSETAAVLHRLEYALDEVRSGFGQWSASMFEGDERSRPYFQLEEVGKDADQLLGQLRIQLGPTHPATNAFSEAFSASLDIFRALGLVRMEDPAIKGTYAAEEVAEMLADQRERMRIARVMFDDRSKKFVELAHAAAGAELPPE